MNCHQLILNCISGGMHNDATVSAALDAIREESGCTLLAAVLEVARVYRAAKDAREITEATAHLADTSPICRLLKESIESNCLNLPEGAYCTVSVVAGDQFPTAVDNSIDSGVYTVVLAAITVGAYWVKREASRIMLEIERDGRRPRTRRSR